MKLKILFIALLISGLSWGQSIFTNPINGTNPNASNPYTSGQIVDANITVSGIGRGSGITGSNATNRYNAQGWSTSTIDLNDYYEFTLTPNSGYKIDFVSFVYTSQVSSGTPSHAFRCSVDGYASNIGTPTTTGTTISLSAAAYQGVTGAITFRFYSYGLAAATTTFSINDFTFNGTVTPTCSPATNPNGSIVLASSTCGSTTLTYNGTDKATCIWQTTSLGTDTAGTPASSDITVTTSGTYYIRNYAGSCWSTADVSSTITVSKNPTVTGNPSNASIIETANTSFTVTATNPGTYQWQVSTDGGSNYNNITNGGVYSGATTATLTLTGVPLSMNGYMYKCIVFANVPCALPAVSTAATLTVAPNVNSNSDLAAVASSEAATISTTVNNITIASSTDGVKVWEFYVRDGGASLNDADAYPTILNSLTITKTVGNAVASWSDAIYSVALFDGTAFVASGSVSATQISFTGLAVSVSDNTQKKLTLRLSLKCPLGVGAVDGDDFGFSIAKANVVFSSSGSGMLSSFTTIGSANGSDVIDVTATKLAFTTQPTGTGINNTMSSVVVKATDACGNIDTGFTGTVSLTSTGTMNAVTPVTMTAGVATFSTIVHTATGTGLTLTASAAGLTAGTSSSFDITTITTLMPGDIAILAFNTDTVGGGTGSDEVSFVTFVDITPGTRIDMTDNAYQKCGTPNGWGISEGWIRFERLNSTLPKGSIVTINVGPNGGAPSVYSPDPSNWLCTKPQPSSQGSFDLNNGGEQIFFMSGGNVGGTNANTATSDGGTYSGNFLYGFNTKGNVWTPICDNSTNGGTKNSDKPKNFDCFLTWPTTQADLNKYTGPMTPATQRDWVSRISDSANWTGYANNTAYNAGPNFYGASITILTGGYSAGVWVGDKNTDWFDCANWQSRKVPDATVNVNVGANSVQGVVVDATSVNASSFNFIAQCKDLAVSKYDVKVEGSASNILEINGNVTLSSTGAIDMDDSNPATADGVIKLYGNWTNNVSSAAFSEGNGTVQFVGSTPQVISSIANEGTEVFYNVILDNNFDTAVSNDLIASGDLTIKSGRTVSIDSNGFIKAYKKLDHSGTLTIEDNGQFIQVDETDTNVGTYNSSTFKVKRYADVNQSDYVYWSSPTTSFDQTNILSNGMRFIWNTTYANADTQGNWNWASTEAGYPAMTKGKGYAIGVPNSSPARPAAPTSQLTTFTGKPNNGQFTFPISKGTITADFTNASGVYTTKYDDNWNLVGNPYPSALDAEKFLQLNTGAIEGTVWVWKHGQKPDSTQNPFYANFAQNYYSTDYIKYNKMGASDTSFSGKIASGQGFMVCMAESFAGSNTTITFNNSMRSDAASVTNPYAPYNNTDFYRLAGNTANSTADDLGTVEEKSRIWLDIINNQSNQTDTTLLGYSTFSTLGRDHFYDAIFVPRSTVALYSLIEGETFIIQGRPLPFDNQDRVPMGINITQTGVHTIAIKKVDGIFAEETPIYLEDKELSIIHDLKQAPYVFTSEKGIFNNRFVLRYTNETLGNHDFDSLDRNVIVVAKNGEMTINSYLENLDQVTVYDILGRQLLDVKGIAGSTLVRSNITTSPQTLLVKIRLADGTVVTRKIIL
ncbi:T9SS sorting signal type C domain-containing protein [Flavobacterium silvisoli]|uniref:T9SS sorting signal type C domain-containing protein n=1 Tax=Flavobacterium silvisoli TaxID=2529433 RepID=A0A4Q9Z2V2_9FLAO|nr:T9SS sorting signal type C domain-containing protein [Flavobacterium silvisoli]TBX70722.1 T9SS sorting signal type C domain-containing protein [Flavobacterium silvisoli]